MFELFDRTIKKSDMGWGFIQRRVIWAVLLAGIGVAASANAATISQRDPKSGLLTWTNTQDGFSLSLQQLTPDNVRAIYEGMGASPANVDRIANYCVFGTDARDNAGSAITYDVATWRAVTRNHIRHRLRSKRGWQRIWRAQGVDYGFSIFPAQQTFQPGDWGEGFTTIKLKPGTRFNLIYHWTDHGHTHTATLRHVQCADRK